MAMDLFVLLYEAMAAATFILLLVLLVLIPSKKRVLEGRAGGTMRSPLVPALIILALALALLTVPLALVIVKDALILVLTSAFIVPASAFALWDYRRTRRLFEKVMDSRPLHAGVVPMAHEADELPLESVTHADPSHTPLPATIESYHMMVECPNCRGRINVLPHQTTLTCPYCGLSGSL